MSMSSKLNDLCALTFNLNETYETIFELNEKLQIDDDEFYSTTSTSVDEDKLEKLLVASKEARDSLITWYHSQTLLEIQLQLHVTISLLTAKIRFIEFKLGRCEAIDLHQSCSLALVDFTNVLAEMTIHRRTEAAPKKKTMTMVSTEIDMPIWVSHYRNLICHAPLQGPNISILIQLVVKALSYMNESFWSKVLFRKTFSASKCIPLIDILTNYTTITSVNQQLTIRKDIEFSKTALKTANRDILKCKKVCEKLRAVIYKHPDQLIGLIVQYIIQHEPTDRTKNCALLLEQVILTKGCFEKFVFKLLAHVKERPDDKRAINWLTKIINVTSYKKSKRAATLRKSLKRIHVNMSIKIIRYTNIPPVKCCHLAQELSQIDRGWVFPLIKRLRHKLKPILGRVRTVWFLQMTKIVHKTGYQKTIALPRKVVK